MQRLGTQEIARTRFGIGRPPGRMNPADYVLAPLKGDEEILAMEVADRAIQADRNVADRRHRDRHDASYNGSIEEKAQPVKDEPPKG